MVGAALGHAADAGALGGKGGAISAATPDLMAFFGSKENLFSFSVVVLSAKLAKVDGPIKREEIAAFRAEHKDIIVKPLFGNGGAGVFHLPPGDENLNSLLEMFTERNREPVIVQRYLPEVRVGDKRIVLVDGVAVGAINRVPAEGEARSNLHVGGTALPSKLTRREEDICAALGPVLRERGLIFVGIDVIGDYLTEINVTSPTGIQQIEAFDGTNAAGLIWDAIEARRSASA
jgi:glutathione synthase